jgi:dihydrofolate reductase
VSKCRARLRPCGVRRPGDDPRRRPTTHQSAIAEVLNQPLSQELLARDLTRLAFTGLDGTPGRFRPGSSGEYGRKRNNLTKFVASSKLDDAPWGDFPAATVTRDPAATIRELKEQSGRDIWLWGSLKLMHHLLGAGVVDEVRMLVCPASRGTGTRIFEDWQDLKLVEATGFENGLVLMRYEIKN